MPDLVAVALMVAGAVAVSLGTRWLIGLLRPAQALDPFDVAPAIPYDGLLITPTGARAPLEWSSLERLEAAASVPMEDIIAAAEWRAEHPDEPVPQILADLDPETRQRFTPMPTGVIAAAWVDWPPLDVTGVIERFTAAKSAGKGGAILTSGMECRVEDVTSGAHPGGGSRYAGCNHPGASREELMSRGSEIPLDTFVTDCEQCDLIARYKELNDRMGTLLEAAESATERGLNCAATLALFNQLQREHDQIRRQLNDADALDVAARSREATLASLRTEGSTA